MAPAQIDHIVILLRYADLLAPPAWITDNFTVTPGGRHSDGRTENKLVVFQDGSYLELLAFINDNAYLRHAHPWGDKPFGFVDFALTNHAGQFDYAGLRGRINRRGGRLGIDYALPVEGGRTRPDGQQVRWKVTFPVDLSPAAVSPPVPQHPHRHQHEQQQQQQQQRQHTNRSGEIPFWCHDVTPRAVRVDTSPASTTHPSGALGIAQFTVLVPTDKADRYVDLYASIMDTQPVRAFDTTRLPLDAPIAVPGLVKPWLFVEQPSLDAERRRLAERGVGIVEVALRVGTDGSVGVARAPISEEGVWIHFLK